MQPAELLLYGFLVVAVILFNLVMQLLARRSRPPAEGAPPPVPPDLASRRPAPLPSPEEFWGRLPEAVQPPAPPAARSAATPRDQRPWARERAVSPLLGSRQDLRRAVVLMTVLGPCRALAPYEGPDGSSTPQRPMPPART